jgi:hypothetical protein
VSNITNLHGLADGLTAPVMDFIQGESDTSDGMDAATWAGHMEALRSDLEAAIQVVIGGTDPLHVVLTQPAYGVAANPDVVLAQLGLAQDNPLYFLNCPMYRMPYSSVDNIHLTNVGYKLLGAYNGICNADILAGRKPQWLNPVSAIIDGSTIVIRFDVPVGPLVLDPDSLGVTTNHGFRVVDGGGTVPITSVVAGADTVTIECGSVPAGAVSVRYALDYLGAGLEIGSGASGTLRDSAPDLIAIDGTGFQLFNPAPHFQLIAYSIEV